MLCLLFNPIQFIQQNMFKLNSDYENISTKNDGIEDKGKYLL